jgi:uncharacterized SAM-binding protein YcdF (DUF218 family)
MSSFLTAQDFLIWLTSASGLGVAVTFIVGLIKRYWEVEGELAFLLTAVVAVVIGGGASLLLQYEVYQYIEQYWGLLLAIIAAVGGGAITLGSSQLVYHLAPRTGVDKDC